MSCDNVPTTAEIGQAKKNVTDFNTFMTSTSDTFIDSNGTVRYTLDGLINNIDWSYVGKFADGVTFTKSTDFAIDDDGIQWIYTGSLPFSATAGTVPSEPTYQVVHVGTLQLLAGLTAQSDLDKVYVRSFKSVSDMKSGISATGDLIDLSLLAGSKVSWRGYYAESDGGGNWGIVKVGAHTDDGGSIFSLGANLYVKANLTRDIDGRKFGAKFTGGYDDHPHISKAITYLGVRGAVKVSGNPTFLAPLVFPKQARGMRLYADSLTNIACQHNGDGIVMEFDNENYGRCVIENIQLTGPNALYPPVGYVPPSTGAGIRMRTAYDNTLINVIVYGFDIGVFLNQGFNNKTLGNCEFQFNEVGVYFYNSRGATNVNNFSTSKIRENRKIGVLLDGSGGQAPITQNYFQCCYIESNSKWAGSGYVAGGSGDGTWSVGVKLFRAYENNFDGSYMENHEYGIWVDSQSSNNKLTNIRHDYSSDLTRRDKIKINGGYCLGNNFDGQIYSSTERLFAHFESNHAEQTGSISDCIGINLINESILGKFTTRNNVSFALNGGTPEGTISRPHQGYVSNPGEGTTSGKIQGIGTTTATLHCYGLSEVSLQTQITAPTTITTFSGLKAGQIFTLWNYQNAQPITIKNGGPLGKIVLNGAADVVLDDYADTLVFWVNGLGRAVEIGRRINQ